MDQWNKEEHICTLSDVIFFSEFKFNIDAFFSFFVSLSMHKHIRGFQKYSNCLILSMLDISLDHVL